MIKRYFIYIFSDICKYICDFLDIDDLFGCHQRFLAIRAAIFICIVFNHMIVTLDSLYMKTYKWTFHLYLPVFYAQKYVT